MFIKSKEPYFLCVSRKISNNIVRCLHSAFCTKHEAPAHHHRAELLPSRSIDMAEIRWSNLIFETYENIIIEQWTSIFYHKRRNPIAVVCIRCFSFPNLLNWNPCNQINNDVLYHGIFFSLSFCLFLLVHDIRYCYEKTSRDMIEDSLRKGKKYNR